MKARWSYLAREYVIVCRRQLKVTQDPHFAETKSAVKFFVLKWFKVADCYRIFPVRGFFWMVCWSQEWLLRVSKFIKFLMMSLLFAPSFTSEIKLNLQKFRPKLVGLIPNNLKAGVWGHGFRNLGWRLFGACFGFGHFFIMHRGRWGWFHGLPATSLWDYWPSFCLSWKLVQPVSDLRLSSWCYSPLTVH